MILNRVIVPERRSLSYALQNFILNIATSIFPYLAGKRVDQTTQNLVGQNFGQNSTSSLDLLQQNLLYQEIRMLSILECLVYAMVGFSLASLFWSIASLFWGKDEDKKLAILEMSRQKTTLAS